MTVTLAEAQAEIVELRQQLEQKDMQMRVLRHFTGKHDLDDLAQKTEEVAATESPEIGSRVKVIHAASKYNPKDFEKHGTWDSYKGEYAEAVNNGDLGMIVNKAPHFKKADLEVFLIKFDNNKAAVMSRKGFKPFLYVGGPVSIINQGAKYAAKDFKDKDGFQDLTLTDEVRMGQRGLLVRMAPHYKVATNICYVVALDDTMKSAVMAAKGVGSFDPPGLEQRLAQRKKEREEKEQEAKRKAEGGDEPEAKKACTEASKAEETPSS
eukprot:TRINITY_DN361_c0_g1_i3.p1 TRINITY_DN361_c0_g1~~TRINITY_DN361_c0_g1_i3.p1  ORF type:complete len:296 (+),score=172.45 TRINITY_DN361_c0_g1_i3:93-890(+)